LGSIKNSVSSDQKLALVLLVRTIITVRDCSGFREPGAFGEWCPVYSVALEAGQAYTTEGVDSGCWLGCKRKFWVSWEVLLLQGCTKLLI
jgi:hypothetical protein